MPRHLAVIWGAIALCLILSFTADAQTRVAVVDTDRLLTESVAARSLQQQLNQRFDVEKTRLDAEADAIRQAQADLIAREPLLTADARREMTDALKERAGHHARAIEDFERNMDRQRQAGIDDISRDAMRATEVVRQRGGIDIVMQRKDLMAHGPDVDITDDVLAEMAAG